MSPLAKGATAGGTCPSGVPSGITSCYYIAANGVDSASGTSEASPWLHAPGMTGCSGACAAVTPTQGQGFIVRGGDTWHYSAGSPVGLPWTWSWNGSSSKPIYIGIDPSWSVGGNWARPILTMDNPLSNNQPSSCTYDDNSNTAVSLNGVSNVTFDNFEFTGKCWGGEPSGASLNLGTGATNVTVSNSYFHGWTMAKTATDDRHFMIGSYTTNSNTGNVYSGNVFDGSDSTFGNVCTTPTCVGNFSATQGAATGWAIAGECYDVHGNVFRHVSNGIECGNITIVHDNLFEYLFEPLNNAPHGNVVESLGGYTGETAYFYNNVTRNTNEGVNWWPQFTNAYIFNNVWENDGHYSPDANCLMISPPGASNIAETVNAFVYNNTFDGTCSAQAQAGNTWTPHWASGSSLTFANNHILDRTSISGFFTCNSPSVCGQTDSGGEVFQTTSAANAQGYTLANNFQPTSGSGATVGAGNNASSSCATFSPDRSLCAGTSDGSSEGPDYIAVDPAIPMIPRASSWDAGAYEFGSGGSDPNPPTGLTAAVQ
jgi:hypothetical protein